MLAKLFRLILVSAATVPLASGAWACETMSPDISDLTTEMNRVAAELGAGVDQSAMGDGPGQITLDEYVAECGSLETCITLIEAQIRDNKQSVASVDCTASPEARATCKVIRLSIEGNQRTLDWMKCHAN